jgi:RNA polymerase sigma factor (sigma-70 family)
LFAKSADPNIVGSIQVNLVEGREIVNEIIFDFFNMNVSQHLTSLFESHQSDLRRLIMRKFRKTTQDAEDIVQDTFHNILRIDNLAELENPKAYLYQTAANLALNRIRKQKNHHSYVNEMDAEATYDLCPERVVSSSKDLQRIEASLHQLPEKYRRTFLLSRMQDKSYKEISELLNISESTVEKHIIKTLKFLRDTLAEDLAS